jgi:DNA-binding transcriptional ArsR family regulator
VQQAHPRVHIAVVLSGITVILNRVVKSRQLDRTFSALSDPTRRDILERLGHGPATLSELAHPLDMSLPGVLKHVRVLESARLVTTQRNGRTRECRLGPEHLDDASQWIAMYRRHWEGRLDRLEGFIEKASAQAT